MSDNDVMKALEVCGSGTRCNECPPAVSAWCVNTLMLEALELIKRQKSEIEKLKKRLCDVSSGRIG